MTKVYLLTHSIDGRLKKALALPSVTLCIDAITGVIGHNLDAELIRRNISHSVATDSDWVKNPKPFTYVYKDENDSRHVFRVDKQELKIGVKLH